MFSSSKMSFSNHKLSTGMPPAPSSSTSSVSDCNPNYITEGGLTSENGFPLNCGMWYVPSGNTVPSGTPVETPSDWFVNVVTVGSNKRYEMYKAVSLFGMDFGPPGGPGPTTTLSVVVGNSTQTWVAELFSRQSGGVCPTGSIWTGTLCIPLKCCTPNGGPCSAPTGDAGRCGECVLFNC